MTITRLSIVLLAGAALSACVAEGSRTTPITTEAAAPRAPGTQLLPAIAEQELRELVAGNTLTGRQDGTEWYEFHGPDGQLYGWTDSGESYEAAYSFAERAICYDYPGADEDGCWAVGAVDGGYYATNLATREAAGPMALLPGNPMQLGALR